MRPILLLALICLISALYAADDASTEKKKVTHHVQFLIGNYVSESVMYKPLINQKVAYAPLYSYSLGFDYKVEFCEHFGLRTGINYFTYGVSVKEHQTLDLINFVSPPRQASETYKSTTFTSSILIPIHFMYYQPLGRGRLVFSVGPDIYLPTNTFGKESYNSTNYGNRSDNIHTHADPQFFFTNANLGITIGMGYEKKISDKFSVEFLPDFRLLDAVPFDFNRNLGNEAIPRYTYYPFNMALGLSTYITFY